MTPNAATGRAGGTEIPAEAVDRGAVFLLADSVVLLLHPMVPAPQRPPSYGLVGENAGMVRIRERIQRLAKLSEAVLLRGETGTGKELAARALHDAGPRSGGPYVAVNLSRIPRELAAAELFGAARGAYTGADGKRRGLFQQADGGTLFLDEIGQVPREVQDALLRVLEDGRVRPVGASRASRVDVRVIAATDLDLDAAMETGKFRAPLFHRLAFDEIELPPLRERRDDLGRLFFHFLRLELEKIGEAHRLEAAGHDDPPFVSADLVARLAAYGWPGNVRELRNVVHQLVFESHDEDRLRWAASVERRLAGAPDEVPSSAAERHRDPPGRRDADDVDEEELVETLEQCRWIVHRAAEVLGVARSSLIKRIGRSPNVRKGVELSREEIERARVACDGKYEAMVDLLRVSKRAIVRRMKELKLE